MFGGASGGGSHFMFPQERCSKRERRLWVRMGWGGLRLEKD